MSSKRIVLQDYNSSVIRILVRVRINLSNNQLVIETSLLFYVSTKLSKVTELIKYTTSHL